MASLARLCDWPLCVCLGTCLAHGPFEFGEIREILARFRRFERFSPVPFDQLASYEGRVGISYDEPLVLVCFVIWGFARGSDVVSGELGRGTLEMLLSQPISRARLLLNHGVISALGIFLLVLTHWFGIWVGIHTTAVKEVPAPVVIEIPLTNWSFPVRSQDEPVLVPLSERVNAGIYLPSAINLAAMGWLMLGLAAGLSCCERYRWRTVGVAVGIHAVQVVLYGFSRAADSLAFLRYFTYCSLYHPQELSQTVVREGRLSAAFELWEGSLPIGPAAAPLLLFLLGTLIWLGGAGVFMKRDLPAPL